ncbi:MAG: TlpA family protein disulfide reductase, partial [Muribaculaceae bacterium]|nr:TlpA family protein disulfide reductase [Muribaculaceae bacterium]
IQDDTLKLDCTFSNGNLTVVPSNKNGFNAYPMDNNEQRNMAAYVNSEFFNLVSYTPDNPVITHGITDPQKVYAAGDTAWREVLRQQDNAYLPIINRQRAKELLHGDELRIYLNNLSCFIYGMEHLRYDKQRNGWAPEGNRELPPLEYYDFLNRIDFSQLTDFVPHYSPYHILKNILLYFPVKIEPIGNVPVDQWQAQAREKLGKVLTDIPDSMLRLLSAASYKMQLDDNKPFTPTQIKNISEAYTTDDLDRILLNANNRLEAQLKERLNVHDLTAEQSFNLKDFIDANYPGHPVVVDFWNTWCGPCLKAHKDTEAIKALPEAQNVVFLYVSDTSSDLEAFNKLAPQIGGEQLRLSMEVAGEFLESEGYKSIPSYFFFDSNHNLIHKQTAFPGQEKYKHLLQQIN